MPVRRSIKALAPRPWWTTKSASSYFARSRSGWPRPMPLEPHAQGFIPVPVGDLEQSTVDHWAFATIPSYPAFGAVVRRWLLGYPNELVLTEIGPRSRASIKLGPFRCAIRVQRCQGRAYEDAEALHGRRRMCTRHGCGAAAVGTMAASLLPPHWDGAVAQVVGAAVWAVAGYVAMWTGLVIYHLWRYRSSGFRDHDWLARHDDWSVLDQLRFERRTRMGLTR
jgi:hypothetical protein